MACSKQTGPSASSAKGAAPAHSQYASKFPKATSTGNKLQDTDNESKREMAIAVVDALVTDLDHAPGLHAALMKRLRLLQESKPSESVFKNAASAKSLDEDFIITWLAQHGDFTVDVVLLAKKHDTETPQQLFMFALVFPPGLRFPADMIYREVAAGYFDIRLKEVVADWPTSKRRVASNLTAS